MSKCILPLDIDVPVKSLVHHACPLAIIKGQSSENLCKYLTTNYIQLVWYEGITGCEFNFYEDFFPYKDIFEHEYLSDVLIRKNNIDILDYVRIAIKNGYYIYLCSDMMYFPFAKDYKISHFIHDYLIFGYDDSEKSLNYAGYTNRYFTTVRISYNDFINSSPSFIIFLKLKSDYNFDINIPQIKWSLSQFIDPKEQYEISNRKREKPRLYGKDVYTNFNIYLSKIQETKDFINLVPFYVLLEHKKLMYSRLEKIGISNTNEITHSYSSIVSLCDKITKVILKYNISKNLYLLKNVQNYIDELIPTEISLLNDFIRMI